MKTPVLESLFNKVVGLKACNFITKSFQRWCFPVNIAKFLRTTFWKNTSGGCFCWLFHLQNLEFQVYFTFFSLHVFCTFIFYVLCICISKFKKIFTQQNYVKIFIVPMTPKVLPFLSNLISFFQEGFKKAQVSSLKVTNVSFELHHDSFRIDLVYWRIFRKNIFRETAPSQENLSFKFGAL